MHDDDQQLEDESMEVMSHRYRMNLFTNCLSFEESSDSLRYTLLLRSHADSMQLVIVIGYNENCRL